MRLVGSLLPSLPARADLDGVSLAQMPLLAAQGLWVRARTPRLPEAGRPFTGLAAPDSDAVQPPLRLLVVGESTAAGVGASSHAAGLTGQIAAALAGKTNRAVAWRVLGRNGATAADVARDLLPLLEDGYEADVAVIALGVNDVIRLTPADQWRTDLARLVAHLRGLTGAPLVAIAGVPPMERFPALPALLARTLGARARQLDSAGAEMGGIGSGILHCPTPLPDPEHFASDRFHPGEVGYAGWGGMLAAAIAPALDGSPTACSAAAAQNSPLDRA